MKSCPTCGHAMAGKDEPTASLEAEMGGEGEGDVGDDEAAAKDEILAELMDQLGGVLEGKLKSKRPPVA